MENLKQSEYKVGDLVYDALIYDGLNSFLTDLDFYKKWMPADKKAQVLELCCGSGRLTIPLAKAGLNITGVDNSKSMLEYAQYKANRDNVNVCFFEADMRSFDTGNMYDLIFIPFNSIHHLYNNSDLFDTLNVVKKHLKDEGLFIFDCYNPNIQYITEAEKDKTTIAQYSTSDGRNVRIQQTMRYERASQVNRIEWHYFINDVFHSVQNLDMRMYFPRELDAYLKWYNFEIIHKYGNFDEQEFRNDSDKQIIVCRKRFA